jgi:Uma2 family endonuclease
MIVQRTTARTFGPADHGRAVTDAELTAARWIGGYHYEVIDGRLYVSPSPDLPHDDLVEWLAEALRTYARARPEVINAVKTRSRVFVPRRRRTTAPEPDLAAYRDYPYQVPRLQRRWQDVSPVLVAEVVSGDVDKDLVRNVALYKRVPSVQEYWVMNQWMGADDFFFRVYRRRGAKWQKPIDLALGDTYTTRLLPGFSLPINPDAP